MALREHKYEIKADIPEIDDKFHVWHMRTDTFCVEDGEIKVKHGDTKGVMTLCACHGGKEFTDPDSFMEFLKQPHPKAPIKGSIMIDWRKNGFLTAISIAGQ